MPNENKNCSVYERHLLKSFTANCCFDILSMWFEWTTRRIHGVQAAGLKKSAALKKEKCMKKYEIKSIKTISLLKTFFYILVLPLVLYLLLGTVILITGLVTQDDFFIHDGLQYFLSAVLVVGVLEAVAFLTAVIYNFLAKHFGGLVLTLEEKEQSSK